MKTWTLRLAKILAGLAAVLLVLHTVLLVASGLALRNAREELRAAGRPMAPAEIIPKKVPASENAAPLYTSAFALLDSESVEDKPLKFFVADAGRDYTMDPDSEDKRFAFEQAIANETFVQAFDLIQQAAARPRCNFDLPYDQGYAMRVPHVNGLLAIHRILASKIMLETRRGEAQNAWQSVELALRIANSLRDEPVLISHLVRIAQYKTALASVRFVAGTSPPDDETTARLDRLVAAADDLAPYLLGLDGERLLFGESTFQHLPAKYDPHMYTIVGEGSSWLKPMVWLLIHYAPALQSDHALYLRSMHAFMQEARQPYWINGPKQDRNINFPWYSTITRLILPALAPSRTHMVALQANARVTRTGLALLRHKLAHGAYPLSLAEIDPAFLPEIPPDPFTGQPLVYRPEADGFVLYSLGENLKDDNGTEESTDNKKTKAFDIVWRMSR